MTLTDDEQTEPTAELTGGANADRRPITDINAWLDGLEGGVAERDTAEDADRFTARCLGAADCGHLLDEERPLNPVSRLTTTVTSAKSSAAPYYPVTVDTSAPRRCWAKWAAGATWLRCRQGCTCDE
jgi:hypothetical protein